jgi:predicted short-subunit dehydrogenase-like oxidoreductase (DUF2520 family)
MVTPVDPGGTTIHSDEAVTFAQRNGPSVAVVPLADRYLARELELPPSDDIPDCLRLAIVGAGRLGVAIHQALSAAGMTVAGPLGRGADPHGCEAVLLCVPDSEIANAAAAVSGAPLVGHCSGATTLEPLAGHEAFSLHPLMTVTAEGATFAGAAAAVDGSTDRALAYAVRLAEALGMQPVHVSAEDRAAYHAAASIASNFLVTIEGAAERVAAAAGIERAQLVPLVRASVENWARLGAAGALTGPVARGDAATVERQRQAIAERTPDLLQLFDSLVVAAAALAAGSALEAA